MAYVDLTGLASEGPRSGLIEKDVMATWAMLQDFSGHLGPLADLPQPCPPHHMYQKSKSKLRASESDQNPFEDLLEHTDTWAASG